MKKLVFVVALLTLATVSFAQFSGGAKAGVNFSGVSGDDADGTDGKIGFHVGVYGNFAFTDKLSLQPELLYNAGGAKRDLSVDTGQGIVDVEATSKFAYLSIPILINFEIVDNFSLQAGPQIGLLLSAKEEYEADGQSDEEDVKDQYKGSDFSFNIGAVYSFGKLNAGLRYTLGLANIADYDGGDLKINNFQVSVGYKLFGGE